MRSPNVSNNSGHELPSSSGYDLCSFEDGNFENGDLDLGYHFWRPGTQLPLGPRSPYPFARNLHNGPTQFLDDRSGADTKLTVIAQLGYIVAGFGIVANVIDRDRFDIHELPPAEQLEDIVIGQPWDAGTNELHKLGAVESVFFPAPDDAVQTMRCIRSGLKNIVNSGLEALGRAHAQYVGINLPS